MPVNNNSSVNTQDYTAKSQRTSDKKNKDLVGSSVPNDYLGKDAFLQLMITQLRYQDPLEPMDNKDSIAQMAQFSALEQMQNLNTTMNTSQSGIKLAIDGLSETLGAIQKALAAYGIKVDTPEKLNTYLNEHGDNSKGKWKAITGYDEKFIRQIAEESFKTIVAPPTKDNNQATHGTSFYLVDQNSRLIKSYSGTDTGDKKFPKAEIVEDVKLQIKQGPYEK